MSAVTPAFSGEMQLLSWSDTSNAGPKIVLSLACSDELEPFKSMTLKKGSQAGQRLAVVIVEIGEDEQPVDAPPRALSVQAALLCKTVAFQQYVVRLQGSSSQSPGDREHEATLYLRKVCGIASRAELDRNGVAATLFASLLDSYGRASRAQLSMRGPT